jgi:hypothetical protein
VRGMHHGISAVPRAGGAVTTPLSRRRRRTRRDRLLFGVRHPVDHEARRPNRRRPRPCGLRQ